MTEEHGRKEGYSEPHVQIKEKSKKGSIPSIMHPFYIHLPSLWITPSLEEWMLKYWHVEAAVGARLTHQVGVALVSGQSTDISLCYDNVNALLGKFSDVLCRS